MVFPYNTVPGGQEEMLLDKGPQTQQLFLESIMITILIWANIIIVIIFWSAMANIMEFQFLQTLN